MGADRGALLVLVAFVAMGALGAARPKGFSQDVVDLVFANLTCRFDIHPSAHENVIGKGGFGIILSGIDRSLNKWVAIKLVERTTPRQQVAFNRECVVNQRIRSRRHLLPDPDLILLSSVCEVIADIGVIVMNGIEWKLSELVDSFNGVQWFRAMKDIAFGLQQLHEIALVAHLDVKAGNIFYDHKRPILFDFGLSAIIDPDTDLCLIDEYREVGHPFRPGTRGYKAPEVAKGDSWGAQADIYSFGVMLYVVALEFNGTFGFDERSEWRDFAHELVDAPLLPTEICQNLDGICPLIQRCTQLDPLERPTSRQLVEELDRLLAGSQRSNKSTRTGSKKEFVDDQWRKVLDSIYETPAKRNVGRDTHIDIDMSLMIIPFVVQLLIIMALIALCITRLVRRYGGHQSQTYSPA